MSTLPKLALIPSGYKASKVYSVLPTDGVGDFDFSRSGQATRINKNGLIETVGSNVPRLNYPMIDGVVSGCPSLLLEPQRTNLIQYSEDFSQWTGIGINITPNNIVSPNGTLDADKVESTGAFFGKYIQPTISSSVNYTGSVFVKNANDNNSITFRLLLGSNDCRYIFNISDLTVTAVSGFTSGFVSSNIEDYGNGWFRCSLTASSNGTSSVFAIYPKILDNSETKSANLWGAQLEQGSYPTSYIPTNGSSVTRVAETCNGAGDANTFNDSEGVLFAEISALADDLTNRRITIDDGTGNNRIILGYYTASNSLLIDVASQGTGAYTKVAYVPAVTNFNKIALKYKENDFALWVNGLEIDVDLSGITPINLNNLKFDGGSGLVPFYGNIKQLQYFDSALNDTELEELTSWKSFREMATSQLYSIQ